MKTIRFLLTFALFVMVSSSVMAQDSEYGQMKANGLIPFPVEENIIPAVIPEIMEFDGGRSSGLFIPLDGTFSVVPFANDYLGQTSPPLYRNDDGWFGPLTLGFTFCFYETDYTQVYINNNGNLSFDNPYATYTAIGFPSNVYSMIAPFWGDVDTRNANSGVVYYKLEAGRLTVTWDEVGYYNNQGDKLNTFQVIITDGNDILIGTSNNVAFAYEDMAWTTGSASGGSGGFGGVAATVGVNKGDGVNFAQVGRFDAPGVCYDGPYGNNDCVSYLDGKRYVFDACGDEVIIIQPEVPISNWAVYIGIFLILTFVIIRFRKLA